MKFSDIDQTKWQALKPYLDTVIIPITGMTGTESPDEATKALEDLRDWLDPIELQFNGRIVTYPAFHYVGDELPHVLIESLIVNLKQQGFKYVVAVSSKYNVSFAKSSFDAIFTPEAEGELPVYEKATITIMSMWNK